MVQRMNNYIATLEVKLEDKELSLSPQKCEAMWFVKGRRREQPIKIKIGGQEIDYRENVQYLGISLQLNLKWDLHINSMVNKALTALNTLKIFTRIWWGADPKSMLVVYKALIRSHLDFGSILYNKLPKRLVEKMDRVQFGALRLCLGCMKSTPICALMAESGEISLKCRRQILASKFVSKFFSLKQNPLMEIICKLRDRFLQRPNMLNKSPLFVQALEPFLPFRQKVFYNETLPCFNIDFYKQLDQVKIIDLNINKKDLDVKQHFLLVTDRFNDTHHFVYTDASRKDGQVGFGVYIPKVKVKFSSKLPKELTICNAEIAAIHEAVIIILKRKIKKTIIFSDSWSAVQKIGKSQISASSDIMTLRTRRLLLLACEMGYDISLAWTPGHAGIQGNEIADTLANIGRGFNIPKKVFVSSNDIFNIVKNNIIEQHKKEWSQIIGNKGSFYRGIQNHFSQIRWFDKIPYKNRRQITTIIRMRTGHCCTKLHLFKIKVKDDPFCDCGQIEDLNHIFFECPINQIDDFNVYSQLIKVGVTAPLNIEVVLGKPNAEIIDIINKFLNINKIKL